MKKWVFLMGLLAILIAVPPVWAEDGSSLTLLKPGSPEAEALGGYPTLGAEWWQWAFSIPIHDDEGSILHPLEEFDGEKCYVGQRGPVWFIGGRVVADPDEQNPIVHTVEVEERRCTIPVGKAVFFPIFNYEVSYIENPGIKNEQQLRREAETIHYFIEEVSLEIDEVSVPNVQEYFKALSSPLTRFFLPEDNCLQLLGVDAPGGTESEFVNDGIHVLIAPVEKRGKHKVHFKGKLVVPDYYELNVDVTYYLTFVD